MRFVSLFIHLRPFYDGLGGFAAQLLSVDTSVAPTTSLNYLQTYPISEFANSLNLAGVNLGGDNFIYGTNTSFSVQVRSVSEPTSVLLLSLGLMALGWLRYKKRHASV
jgi:hypothetical protein